MKLRMCNEHFKANKNIGLGPARNISFYHSGGIELGSPITCALGAFNF